MKMLNFTIKKTQMRLTREIILDLYSKGVKEWGSLIKHFDELDARADKQKPISSTQADDDLAAWLENMKLEEGEDARPHVCSHPKISTNSVALYRCSWCGNPSAVLRKCGGCAKTRYVFATTCIGRDFLTVSVDIATDSARRSTGPSIKPTARSRASLGLRPTAAPQCGIVDSKIYVPSVNHASYHVECIIHF